MDQFGSKGCTETQTCAYQNDESYIGNIPHSHDFFMYVKPNVWPHITHVSEDGFTFVHSHPPHLRGTKFFQWGKDYSGMFQQDFMSASDYENKNCPHPYYDPWCTDYEHEGDYTELQVGPAPTQMHTFPIPANGVYEWSEFFKGFHGDPKRIHSSNYTDAVSSVNEWINSTDGLNPIKFAEMDVFFTDLAKVAPKQEDVLSQGMPWGGLREKLMGGTPLVPHGACPFATPDYNVETRQWIDLIMNGTFTNDTLMLTPVNFEVDVMWVELLEKSMTTFGATWLHHLLIGTYQLETGNVNDARISFLASISLLPSVHAYRNLAIFAPTVEKAIKLYQLAWSEYSLLDSSTDPSAINVGKDLSGEFAAWLMLNKRWDELEQLLDDIQEIPLYFSRDRVLHSRAALAVQRGNYSASLLILTSECFPTYASERAALIDLWWESKVMEAVDQNKGIPLTKLETIHLRRKLGCDGDTTSSRLLDKCTRGPPNLGLRYAGF